MNRRVFLCAAFGNVGVYGCAAPPIEGSRELLGRLAIRSRKEGLGISFLGTDVLYTQSFSERIDRTELHLSPRVTLSQPVVLVDRGRALVVINGGWFRVVDLSGTLLGEIKRNADIERCVFHRETNRLLYWGPIHSVDEYGIFLADLSRRQSLILYKQPMPPGRPTPRVNAWFVLGASMKIGFSVGFDNFEASLDSRITRVVWRLESAEGSPDGKRMAGRLSNGAVGLVDTQSGLITDTGVQALGRSRWDPSSEFVFVVRRTNALGWCAHTEIVVIDASDTRLLRFCPIALDDQDHLYEWVLLPGASRGSSVGVR